MGRGEIPVELRPEEVPSAASSRPFPASFSYIQWFCIMKGGKPRTALPADKFTWNGPVVAKILDRMDYLGHTVNFKTHVKSYKVHKTIHNNPDQWKSFEDTHDESLANTGLSGHRAFWGGGAGTLHFPRQILCGAQQQKKCSFFIHEVFMF